MKISIVLSSLILIAPCTRSEYLHLYENVDAKHISHMEDCMDFEDFYVCVSANNKGDIPSLKSSLTSPDEIAEALICDPTAEWHLGRLQSRTRSYRKEYGYAKGPEETFVYVVDTFVDVKHPEFDNRATVGYKGTGSSNAHGTHVAGLVGGNTVGVNPYTKIIAVEVLDDNGYGKYSEIIKGLEFVLKDACKKDNTIVNLSIGGPKNSVFERAVTALVNKGILVIAASGNSHADACDFHPSGMDNVITVGSINSNTAISSFSNYGNCVDILAPGEVIHSSIPGSKYGYMSGTSMASPIVAGIASSYMSQGIPGADAVKLGSKDLVEGELLDTSNNLAFMTGLEFCVTKMRMANWWTLPGLYL